MDEPVVVEALVELLLVVTVEKVLMPVEMLEAVDVDDDEELEEPEEFPPVEALPTTVTSRLFTDAQSDVAGTLLCPAYPPPYSTFVPGLGNASSTPSVVVH